jgi:hypothetical protein
VNFPFRHFFLIVVAAFGIATANNVETYHTDIVTICDQVTTQDYRTREERHYHLPECPIPELTIRTAPQAVVTQRPMAPGEDVSTAQLLPEDRVLVDRNRFAEHEGIAALASILAIFVKLGLDVGGREKDEPEQLKREQQDRNTRLERDRWESLRRAEREERAHGRDEIDE